MPFREFVTSLDHMRFPPLSPKQFEAADALLHLDPKKTFNETEKKFDVACCLWGKGSLSFDEKLQDAVTGTTRTVEDWSKLGGQIHLRSYDFKQCKMINVLVDAPIPEDVGDLVEVATQAQYRARVNTEHKFWTPTGYKATKDLKVGDEIACTFGLPIVLSVKYTRVSYLKPIGKGAFYGITVPETGNYIHNSLIHANSGKDSLAALITCYIVYILLCLKKPYEYLTGFDVLDEAIDIVNVAYSFDQASNVFFTKFRSRVKNWAWLRRNFRVRESGKDLDPSQDKKSFLEDRSLDTVTIYPSSIMFPNMIRAFSRHSMVQSTEGLNVICWLLDEASAMSSNGSSEKANADALYEMFKSSAQSRFPNKWFGFILSFPRHKKDFTMRMYKLATEGKIPRMFASKGATWEVNPTKTYENFKAELENPATSRDAKGKYQCEPESQESGFFDFPEKITQAINFARPQAVEFDRSYNTLGPDSKLVAKTISRLNLPRRPDSIKHVARVDLGHVHDRTALVVAHLENKRVIIDLVTHWTAEPGTPIDIDDVASIIIQLKQQFCNIAYCSFDQWNSISSLNRLTRAGIPAERLSLNFEDWKLCRNSIYSQQTELINYPPLTDVDSGELALLQLINGNKVDHPKDGHDDLSQCLAGAITMLLGSRKNLEEVKSIEDHIVGNEDTVATSLWSSGEQYNEGADDPFSSGLAGVSAHLR